METKKLSDQKLASEIVGAELGAEKKEQNEPKPGVNNETAEQTEKKKKKPKKKSKPAKDNETADNEPKTGENAKDEEESAEEETAQDNENPEKAKKKKKKKSKNAKKPKIDFKKFTEKYPIKYDINESVTKNFDNFQDNSRIINLRNWSQGTSKQTTPPSIPISLLYPKDEELPTGMVEAYKGSLGFRIKDDNWAAKDALYQEKIYCLRRGAVVHRQVRKYAQNIVKPGMRMIDICQHIESTLNYLCEKEGLVRGQAFPTGCSINNVAAHYTPNYGDETVLGPKDVCKIDFGVHYSGYLIDSAFTVAFDPQFDPLLQAVQEATMTGIKEAGIDVRLCDIGEAIQEVMESHEVEINGRIHQVLSVRNLCGHTIDRYKVHAGKSVPIVKGGPQTKMEEGEIYAIETFGSTGKGVVHEDLECSHYMKNYDEPKVALKHPRSKKLLSFIDKNFSTLAFCRRWLDDGGEIGHIVPLKELVDKGVVNTYPPLCDISGSYVAQYEHTFLLKPSGKEIMSIGDDY